MGIKDTIMTWAANKSLQGSFVADPAVSANAEEQQRLSVAAEDHKILSDLAASQTNPVSTEDYKQLLANGGRPDLTNDTLVVPGQLVGTASPVTRPDMQISFHDGDTLYADGMVGRPGYNPHGYRASGFNAPEATYATGQAARAAALAATDRVVIDAAGDGGHGRGTYVAYDAQGRPVSTDLAELGLAFPMAAFNTPESVSDAAFAGDMREAMGLPRSSNPAMVAMEPHIKAYVDTHQIDTSNFQERIEAPGYRHRSGVTGTFSDSVARGKDQTDAAVGAAVEYLGERAGIDGLTEYGRSVRQENTLEAGYNTPLKGSIEDVHSLGDAGTYAVERLGEALPGAAVDAAAMAVTKGSSLGVTIARRGLTAAVRAGLLDQAIKAAGRGAFASGFVQGVGSEQIRMKDAGIDDTGLGPLLNGIATGKLNAVANKLPLTTFLKNAGVDTVTGRSVLQVAADGVKGALAASAHGVAIGGGIGLVQNSIEQSIHLRMDDRLGADDFNLMEDINAAIAAAVGAGSMNLMAHGGAAAYRHAAQTTRSYYKARQDAALAAAEKDFADTTSQQVATGTVLDDGVYSQFKAATDPNHPVFGAKAEPDGAAEPIPPKQTAGAAIMAAFDQVEAEHAAQSAPEVPATDAVAPPETTPTVTTPVVAPPEATSTESAPVVSRQGADERAAVGFGKLHSLAPKDVPNLTSERHRELAGMLLDANDELVPLQRVKELREAGLLTDQEVVQFLADDFDPRTNTVVSRLDNALVNQRMREAFTQKAAEAENAERLSQMAGKRSGLDYKVKSAIVAAQKALIGKFRKVKEDPNAPRFDPETGEDRRYLRQEFSDDASRILAENDVLRRSLKTLGEDPNQFYDGAHDYHMEATYQAAREGGKGAKLVPPPKPETGDVASEPSYRADPEEVIDIDNPNHVEDHLRSRGDAALSEIHTAVDLEGDIQKTRARFEAIAKAGPVDKAKVLSQWINEEMTKAKALPPEERAAAGQRIVDVAEKYMKQAVKDAYSQVHQAINKVDAAKAETTQQEVDFGRVREDGTRTQADVHDTASERALGGQERPMEAEEARHHYTRRTAYARKALEQIGRLIKTDMTPILRMYERDLRPEERALGSKLQAGDAGQATVRVARRDKADSLEAAAGPVTNGKGGASPRDVHQVTRRSLIGIYRAMKNGHYERAYSKLHEMGLLPDEVDVNGKGLSNKTLVQRAAIPEMDTKRAGQALPGVLVDSDGNHTSTRLDMPTLTEAGMKELGYLDANGDLNIGDSTLPRAIAEGTLAGISQAMEPQRGIAFQFEPGMKEPDANTVVWRSPSAPDVFVTWGDIRNHLADVWSREDRAGARLANQIAELHARKAMLEETLADQRFPKDPTDPNRQRVEGDIKALEDRIAELEDTASMYDRDADIAGLHWEEDTHQWHRATDGSASENFQGRNPMNPAYGKQAVGYDEGPTSRTVIKPDHMTDNAGRTALDFAEKHSSSRDGDFADQHAFETRWQLPEDPTLLRPKDYKQHNKQVQATHEGRAADAESTTSRLTAASDELRALQSELDMVERMARNSGPKRLALVEAQVAKAKQAFEAARDIPGNSLEKEQQVKTTRLRYAKLARKLEALRSADPARAAELQTQVAAKKEAVRALERQLVEERAAQASKPLAEGLRHEGGRRVRAEEAKKKAEREAKNAAEREPAAEVTDPVPAKEAMQAERQAEQAMAAKAPEPVRTAIAAAMEPPKATSDTAAAKAQAEKTVQTLVKRFQTIRGSARHHGLAKVLNNVVNVLVNTVQNRLSQITPYVAHGVKVFETEYRLRAQRLATHFKGFDNAKRLQAGYDDWLSGKKTLQQRLLQDAVRKVVAEVQKVDPSFKLDRAPVVFDMLEVQSRLPALREVLYRNGVQDVEAFVRQLHISKGVAGFHLFDGKEAPSQVMGARTRMADLEKAIPALRSEGFLKTDAPEILAGFTDTAAKYLEWSRQFGSQIKGVDGKSTFDPSFKYRVIMDTISASDAAEVRQLVAASTGALGYNTPHWLRVVNSTMFAATAMRCLLFSGVASLPEMAAIGVRARTGLRGSAQVVTSSLWRVAVSDRQALHQMAEGLGIVGNEVVRHTLLNLYRADELTVGKTASRMAHYMFKLNGQYAVTELNSKLAMVHGQMFLAEHGQKAKAGDAKSQRYLEELRISPEDAIAGARDNNVNYQDAVHRFVLQSLTNPEAGVMPLWMSDPKFAVFASLKKFVYGLFDRVHMGVYREAKAGNASGAVAMTAGYVAVAGALGALAEFIRGMVKHPPFTQPAPEQEWDEDFWKVFNATGLQAHWQLAAGPRNAAKWGDSAASPYLAAMNPTLDWIWSDLMDPEKSAAQKTAEALPVASQLPWARSLVTEMLGGSQKAKEE